MKFKIKKYAGILLLLIIPVGVWSQEAEEKEPVYGWTKEIIGNLNFTQNKFDNWAQGGEDSWSWQLDILAKFVENQATYNWANSGKISFGRTKLGDAESRKAADEIKLESVFTYKFVELINPYIAVTAKTQLTNGYQYGDDEKVQISGFLDPGFFTQSIGLGYKPNDQIQTRFGAALKETVTDKFSDIYADGEKTRVEMGAESVTDLNLKLSEKIVFKSKLELFSALSRVNEIDINWDNMFSAKVSEYIQVSFNLKLFYDKDISPKRQLKQTLAVGLTYSFL